jgi:hypothetical protein
MTNAPTEKINESALDRPNHITQPIALAIGKKNDLVSLTDIYKQAQARGLADGKMTPAQWSRKPTEKTSGPKAGSIVSGGPGHEFIAVVAATLNVCFSHIYKSTRGIGGGTFAHKQIALAYAKYLSPALHMEVNSVFLAVQAASPEIADSIVDRMSDDDLERHIARSAGVATRKKFAGKLAARGVAGQGFSDCTNAMYVPLFGGSAKELREIRKLPAKANVRESMPARDLIAIAFTELLAGDRIKAENAFGNNACVHVCNQAAQAVANQLASASRR